MEVLGRVDLSSWFQWQFCHFNYGHYGHCSSVPCPHGRVPRHAAQQHESAVRGETDWLRSLLRIISLQPSFSLSAVSSSGNHVQNVFRYKLCTYYIWWHYPLPITHNSPPRTRLSSGAVSQYHSSWQLTSRWQPCRRNQNCINQECRPWIYSASGTVSGDGLPPSIPVSHLLGGAGR